MAPNLFHRLTAATVVVAMLGSTYPAPLVAQLAAEPEPAPITSNRPLSLPPTGPQPDARLLLEQEQMLARPIVARAPVPAGARPPQAPLPALPKFSDPPTDEEIAMIQLFDEPPIPFGAEKAGENAAFVRMLEEWAKSGRQTNDLTAFGDFLRAHSGSRWEVTLRRQMARAFLSDGFFSRAVSARERAWEIARKSQDEPQRTIAGSIAGDLAELYAQAGRREPLDALVAAVRDRALPDHDTDRIRHAHLRFGAEAVRGRGGSGSCGVSALTALFAELRRNSPEPEVFRNSESRVRLGILAGPEGYSLRQLAALSDAAGLPMRAIRRAPVDPSQPGHRAASAPEWPVPSIVHWTRGHYSALLKRAGSHYLVRDRSMGGDRFVSAEALAEEASGYVLIEDKSLPKGWKAAAAAETESIFGATNIIREEDPDCDSGTGCGSCRGMPVFDFKLYRGSLRIRDTPLAYSPAYGPAVDFTITYSHIDPHNAGTANYSNFGPNWSWLGLSYLEIDDTSAWVYLPGGAREKYEATVNPVTVGYDYQYPAPQGGTPEAGTEFFPGAGVVTFTPAANFYSGAALHCVSHSEVAKVKPPGWPPVGAGTEDLSQYVQNWANTLHPAANWTPPLTLYKWTRPTIFERVGKDGTREVFDYKINGKYFPSKVIHPDGTMIQFSYDAQARVASITDATLLTSQLFYEKPGHPNLITKIVDPYGRSAVFEYDASGRLVAITDAAGMRSSFEYLGISTFIRKMTTPYGDTTFTYEQPQAGIRVLEAVDPMGGRQRLEVREGTTWYWDQRAMRDAPLAGESAHIYQWALSAPGSHAARAIRVKEKHPLENEITYTYDGQTPENPDVAGTSPQPISIKRKVPNFDGQEVDQITQYEYDAQRNVTQVVDPRGRITTFSYTGNHVTAIKQWVTDHDEILAEFLDYDAISQRPQHVKDAAGNTTDYLYDGFGRVQTVTRHRTVGGQPVNETTTYAYHPTNGRLSSVTGPLPGAVTSLGYDTVGRVNSVTTPDGYTVTYLYDPLDRLVKITYPDGTYEQIIYNRLDAEWQRDRAGRWTHAIHNANREVERVTDPAGRIVQFQHCDGCGALEGIVDAEGNRTSFEFDVAGRLTRKLYADGSDLRYDYEPGTSRLQKMTDAKHQVTRFSYYVDNTLQTVAYTNEQNQPLVPPTPGVSYEYDPHYKRLTKMTDQFGETTFAYYPVAPNVPGAGRLHYEDGPEPGNVDKIVHTYDEYGRELSSAINGVADARSYDALGRVATATNPLGTFSYTYAGAGGRLTKVTYPGNHKVEYAYHPILPGANPAQPGNDDLRLSQIKNTRTQYSYYEQVASLFQYGYDKVGNIVSWYQSGGDSQGMYGKVWQLGYDAADQLIGAAVKTAYIYSNPPYIYSTIEQQYGFAYDDAGNRVTEQNAVRQTNGSYQVTLTSATHNELNQLTSRTGGSGQMIFEGTVNEPANVTVGGQSAQVWGLGNGQYGFRGSATVNAGPTSVPIVAADPSGNATTRNAQVQSTGVAIPELLYDANGNLISETRADPTVRTFHWDAENRLVKIIDGASTYEWKYNGRGQRVEERLNGVLGAKWRWDGLQLREMIAGTTTRRYYAHGMQWTPNNAQPATTTNYYFFHDHLGSLREMIDASGSLHKRYSYDLWGRRTQTVNTTTVPEPMIGYTGHFYHANTGLHLAFYRAYSAELGRWLSRDPIDEAGGLNLYEYANSSTVTMIDPDGLEPVLTSVAGGWAISSSAASAATATSTSAAATTVTTAAAGIGLAGGAAAVGVGAAGFGVGYIIGISIAPAIGDFFFPDTKCMSWQCRKALKILKDWDRLAQEHGVHIPEKRKAILREKQRNGTISSNDLPGTLVREMPGEFLGKTLKEIEEICK